MDCTGCQQPLQIGIGIGIGIRMGIYIFLQRLKIRPPQPAHVKQEFDGHEDWIVEVDLVKREFFKAAARCFSFLQ